MSERNPYRNFVDFIEAITLRTDQKMAPWYLRMMHEHLAAGGELAIRYPPRGPCPHMPLVPGVTYVCPRYRVEYHRQRAMEQGLELVEWPRRSGHTNQAAAMFELRPAPNDNHAAEAAATGDEP